MYGPRVHTCALWVFVSFLDLLCHTCASSVFWCASQATPGFTTDLSKESSMADAYYLRKICSCLRNLNSKPSIILLSSAGAFRYASDKINHNTPFSITNKYAEACFHKEILFRQISSEFNYNLLILRVSNAYGLPLIPRRSQGLINKFIYNWSIAQYSTLSVPYQFSMFVNISIEVLQMFGDIGFKTSVRSDSVILAWRIRTKHSFFSGFGFPPN